MKNLKNNFFLSCLFLIAGINLFGQAKVNDTLLLNTFIDQWHLDAATVKLEDYFSVMDNDFIFLGTAPGERWTKSEFYNFCKPYFDKGKAWSFVPSNRNWKIDKKEK